MAKKINLDIARLVASFLVVAIHISPFATISTDLDFCFSRVIARLAVPLFLMITGYFLLPKALDDSSKLKKYIIKIVKLYVFCIIIYLPLNIYKHDFNNLNLITFLKSIFIEGTIYHLWYFPALILGIVLTYLILKKINMKSCLIVFLALYLVGLFGDSYYGIVKQIPFLAAIYDIIFSITDYTRCGLFYVPIFLFLGFWISKSKKNNKNFFLLVISLLSMLIEGMVLYKMDLIRHDSMYLMLLPSMYFLFDILKSSTGKNERLRKISTLVYIFHHYFIVFVRMIANFTNLESLLVRNNFVHYLVVAVTTFIFSSFLIYMKERVENGRKGN